MLVSVCGKQKKKQKTKTEIHKINFTITFYDVLYFEIITKYFYYQFYELHLFQYTQSSNYSFIDLSFD